MIIILGGINADLFTNVACLPRPGETVLAPDYRMFPGGKGANQAVAAARAGAKVEMVATVGEDPFGDQVLAALRDNHVGVSLVGRSGVTGIASVSVEQSGENLIVVASGANRSTRADQVPDPLLTPETTVVMQMEISIPENERLIDRAHAAGCRIILNLAPALPIAPATLDKVDILIANQIEAAQIDPDGANDPPLAQARRIAERHGLDCLITLGADGTVLAARDGTDWRVGALAIEPLDTVGAGDAFVGALSAALDQGRTLPDALHRASIAGALCCLAPGPQDGLPTPEQIEAELPRLAAPVQQV